MDRESKESEKGMILLNLGLTRERAVGVLVTEL